LLLVRRSTIEKIRSSPQTKKFALRNIYEERLYKQGSEETEVDSASGFTESPHSGKRHSQIENQSLAGGGAHQS
jgi:hypothetical protein